MFTYKFFSKNTVVTATVLLLFTAYLFYLNKTAIYKPVNIYVNGIPSANGQELKQLVTLHLYSPLGKELSFNNEKIYGGKSSDYAFIGKITIDISTYFYANYKPVLITAGTDSVFLEKNSFTEIGGIYSANVPVSNSGHLGKAFSVFRWGPIAWTLEYVIWYYFQKVVLYIGIAVGAILGLLFLMVLLRLLSYYLRKKHNDYEKNFRSLRNHLANYISKTARCFRNFVFKNKWLLLLSIAVSGCVAVQTIAYVYFIKYGVVKYVTVLTISFYGFFFFAALLYHVLFHKEKTTLVLVSTTISFCILDAALNFFNFNKSVLEQRSGYYLSQYKPLIANWYYTRMKNSEYCLCNLEYAFQRKANNEGLADGTFTIEKRPREIRILGIGDSFTEGDGTHADSTYLKTTEKLLNTRYPSNDFKFMNAGMCGSDMVFEYQLLKDRLLKYKPDVVMVALNNSDMEDIFVRGGFERFLPNGKVQFRKGPVWEFLFAQNHIFRLWATNLLGADWLLITEKKRDTLVPYSFETLTEALVKFKQLADSSEFKFVLLVHPFKTEWQEKKYRFDMSTFILKTCAANNIDVLDVLTYYTQKKNIPDTSIGKYYWKIDGHHNSKGYALLGEAAAFELQQVFAADSLLLHSQ